MSRGRLDDWRDRRRDPLTFTLDGERYTVPDHPARVWVLAILSEEPADCLLDALDEELAADLWEDACDPYEPVTPELLHRIGQALVSRVAGRTWSEVLYLVQVLVEQWVFFDGMAADRGLGDPLGWSLERLCNWVYLRLTRNADAKERARIDQAMTATASPAEPPTPSPTVPAEAAGWLALAGQSGLTLPG